MKLLDIVQRPFPPVPWQEGDNIPWHEPGFSARMLAEHLSQTHDHASRRTPIIEAHIQWIHETVLHSTPSRILDLGCGPGLYSNRLAELGHTCVGIDYSPASVAYAKENSKRAGLTATYLHEDIRTADYGEKYDLAMLLFGELNVFSKQDATHILLKANRSLRPGGQLLLEPHLYASLIPDAQATNTWFSGNSGLFHPAPHLVLMESTWDQAQAIKTIRYYIIDAATAEVTRYAQSMQAYTPEAYTQLLTGAGFADVKVLPGLAHDRIDPAVAFCAIIASKQI